jgi:hypothetical protein
VAEERRKADADLLRAQGQEGHAKAVEAAPIPVQAPIAPIDIPKVSGSRQVWGFRITDREKAIQAAWKGQYGLSRGMVTIDEVALGKVVRALKENFSCPYVVATVEER